MIELNTFQPRRLPVEHEHEIEIVVRQEPGHAIEQAEQVRCDPSGARAERRAVGLSDEGEELIEITVRIDGEPASAQRIERGLLFDDDGGQQNAHGCNLRP